MAHECPECGMVCHCNGDFDDVEFNGPGSGQERCTCCAGREDEGEHVPYDEDEEPKP